MPQLKYWDPIAGAWMSMPAGPMGPTGPTGPMGAGSASVHVGTESPAPDPASYGLWVVTLDNGPWDAPLAAGTYSLRVSNGTTWFPIAGGGGSGPGVQPPTAAFTADVHWANVIVNASTSTDPDGYIVSYDWDWGDGTPHGSGITAQHNYATSGSKTIVLTVVDNTGAGNQSVQTITTTVMYGPVAFTTAGSTFAPKIELTTASPNSIQWISNAPDPREATVYATGAEPSIDFGSTTDRVVHMYCTRPQDILTVNCGFNWVDDNGTYNLGTTYDHPFQNVRAVTGLTILTELKNFCAARGGGVMTGQLDFTGLSKLEFIECAYSDVTNVILTGCTSVIRICLEQNDTDGTPLNLNPVAATLRDLRRAVSGGLSFTTLTSPLAMLYHFCVRDQILVNPPTIAQMPVNQEWWVWNCGLSTTLGPNLVLGPYQNSVRAWGNGFTSVDVSAANQGTNGLSELVLSSNPLTAVTGLASCRRFQYLEFRSCGMTQGLVNQILSQVNAWGTSGGILYLEGNASPTGGVNNTDRLALVARGWAVNVVA